MAEKKRERHLTEREEVMVTQAALGMLNSEEIEEVYDDPFLQDALERTIASLQRARDYLGEEVFKRCTISIPHSYGDAEDDDGYDDF